MNNVPDFMKNSPMFAGYYRRKFPSDFKKIDVDGNGANETPVKKRRRRVKNVDAPISDADAVEAATLLSSVPDEPLNS